MKKARKKRNKSRDWAVHSLTCLGFSRQQQKLSLKLHGGTLLFSFVFSLRVAAWQRSRKIAARDTASERELFPKCLLSVQSDRAWLISLREINHGNHRATSRHSMLQLNGTEREKFCLKESFWVRRKRISKRILKVCAEQSSRCSNVRVIWVTQFAVCKYLQTQNC